MDRTTMTHDGLIIVVTDEQARAQHATADAIFLSLKDAMPGVDIGVAPDQIDLTVPGEGVHFFVPGSALQEALEGHAQGIRIEPGTYHAARRYDEREDGDQ